MARAVMVEPASRHSAQNSPRIGYRLVPIEHGDIDRAHLAAGVLHAVIPQQMLGDHAGARQRRDDAEMQRDEARRSMRFRDTSTGADVIPAPQQAGIAEPGHEGRGGLRRAPP